MAGLQRGRLTLIGSGELAPSMSRVHRSVAARINGPVRGVFVDTPAGFEPNVDDIAAKAVAYFDKHLGIACDVASFRAASLGPSAAEAATRRIRLANYVFAGPGSPTYAVRNWKKTPVFEAIASRLDEGAEVVMASAAAIAASAFALPVYEIYKSGDGLGWMEGCDLLGPLGYRLAIVPHWNNAEGGGHDTRFCYMGAERFQNLHAMLEPDVVVLGLDEYTACGLNFESGVGEVMGAGAVTVLRGGEHVECGAGESFPLRLLTMEGAKTRPPFVPGPPDPDDIGRRIAEAERAPADLEEHASRVAAIILDLAEALERAQARDDARTDEAKRALDALITKWASRVNSGAASDIGPFIELLIEARQALRAAKAYAQADAVRDGLAAQGVVLEDSRDGTSWRRS